MLLFFVQAPEFPEFTAKVQEAISSLGGSVFPKLNWSAPRVRMLTPKTCNRCCHTEWFVFVFSKSIGRRKRLVVLVKEEVIDKISVKWWIL